MNLTKIIPMLLASTMAQQAHASQTLLFNFSDKSGNDINATEATALGADVYVNIPDNGYGSDKTITFTLNDVSGSTIYADYYQQNQDTRLGQPFSTLMGGKAITATTNRTLTTNTLGSDTQLSLGTWMTNNGYSSYEATVYYAGRDAATKALFTDGTADAFFTGGTTDTVTVTANDSTGGALWGAKGATHTFTSTTLDLEVTHHGQAGISAILIKGIDPVPEPSSVLLSGLGLFSLALRRRR